METEQFCGQSCHVMKPEFTAWKHAPHSHVECVDCHIGPGASGWLASKMAGTRQLADVVLNSFPRPIPSGIESNRLVDSADTCERCHARGREAGSPILIKTSFKDDEQNTRSETVLTMHVGGGRIHVSGIHGAHMGPGVLIRFATADPKRQTIPWVEYRDAQGAVTAFIAADAKPGAVDLLPKYEMQCVDCHNRPAHSFQPAARAIDSALASGDVAATLPFVKKTGLAILTAVYATDDDAAKEIPAKLSSFYQAKYPDLYSKNRKDVDSAGQALLAIYSRNVFPDLKVTWGTYPNNLGHTDAPGCFRCHDEAHLAADKKTISQDCSLCHQLVAMDEASPAVLKTLELSPRQ
jgi:nitrate/TMAO reductase-like tetraheme cytochrome c subunit